MILLVHHLEPYFRAVFPRILRYVLAMQEFDQEPLKLLYVWTAKEHGLLVDDFLSDPELLPYLFDNRDTELKAIGDKAQSEDSFCTTVHSEQESTLRAMDAKIGSPAEMIGTAEKLKSSHVAPHLLENLLSKRAEAFRKALSLASKSGAYEDLISILDVTRSYSDAVFKLLWAQRSFDKVGS